MLSITDTTSTGGSNSGGSNAGNSNSSGSSSSTGGTASGSTTPAAPTAPTEQPGKQDPAAGVNPFQSKVVSREAVLKTVSDSIAATKNVNGTFSDTASHWGGSMIATAVKLRIVDGYKDGTFRPDAPVTRAEFAAMIARAFGLSESTGSAKFPDARSSWAAGYIGALADKGVLSGYGDGSFKPNAAISRAEMVTIIARVLDLGALSTGTSAGFNDVGSGYWAADAIKQASSAKLIQGVSSSAFAPKNQATRAEAVTLLIRALESDSQIKELIAGL
nr:MULTISPECIES: S-layer homology domain-containing protein [Paenibacillus]